MSIDTGVIQEEGDVDVELDDNVVEDLIEFSRGNVILNEEQFLLLNLAYLTGWFENHKQYVNTVFVGTSSSGKSHTVQQAKRLYPKRYMYEATGGSDKSIIDDPSWNEARFAPLDEYNKLSNELVELIKSVSGDDDGYTYKRSVKDQEAERGRTTTEIYKEAKPYSFLYAQFDMDFELYNRLLKLYADESKEKNKAVGRMKAGHTHITVGDGEQEYIFDTTELKRALKQHIQDVPNGRVVLPDWGWYVCKDIFEHQRSESNRIYAMVFNLVRASALLNYDNRDTTSIEVDGEEKEAYVADAQDFANILSCRETLLGTTHELEPRKWTILQTVRHLTAGGSGCTIDDIHKRLKTKDTSLVKKHQLREMLKELDENFYVDIREGAGPNGAHMYHFRTMSNLGSPKLTGLSSIDEDFPDEPLKGTRDPIKDMDFHESVNEFREKYISSTPNDVENFMHGGDETDSGGGQASLTETDDDGDTEVDLAPVEEEVHERLLENDGEYFNLESTEVVHMIGVVDEGETLPETDVSGTIVDPDHEAWDDYPDDAIGSENDAVVELETVVEDLNEDGLWSFGEEDPKTRDYDGKFHPLHVKEVN